MTTTTSDTKKREPGAITVVFGVLALAATFAITVGSAVERAAGAAPRNVAAPYLAMPTTAIAVFVVVSLLVAYGSVFGSKGRGLAYALLALLGAVVVGAGTGIYGAVTEFGPMTTALFASALGSAVGGALGFFAALSFGDLDREHAR